MEANQAIKALAATSSCAASVRCCLPIGCSFWGCLFCPRTSFL